MLEVHSDASLLMLSMMDEVCCQSFLKKLSQTAQFIQEVVL